MTIREWDQYIDNLAVLEKTAAPVVSCYIDVEAWASGKRDDLAKQAGALEHDLPVDAIEDLKRTLARTSVFLEGGLDAQTKGVAVFARGGERPVFFSLQFRVPVTSRISVDSSPWISDLIDLRDTYYRALLRAGWTARWS